MTVLFIGLLCVQLLAGYAVDGVIDNLSEPEETENLTRRSASQGPGHGWNYDVQDTFGPLGWSKIPNDEACAGTNQSPIDIQTASTIEQQDNPLMTYGYKKYSAKSIILLNNGHTVNVKFDYDFDNTDITMLPRIAGGRLNAVYVLHGIHFHWGNKSTEGSEHTIDSQRFPLEAHLVHIKYGYKTFEEAVLQPEGVSVLGVLFQIGGIYNYNKRSLMQSISQVTYMNQEINVKPFNIYSVFPRKYGTMFTYTGSLTTPPCTGTVVWNVVYQNAYTDLSEMLIFRSLQKTVKDSDPTNDQPIEENFRPIQPLNGRPVYRQSQF